MIVVCALCDCCGVGCGLLFVLFIVVCLMFVGYCWFLFGDCRLFKFDVGLLLVDYVCFLLLFEKCCLSFVCLMVAC